MGVRGKPKPKQNLKQPENSQQSYKKQQGFLNNSTKCSIIFQLKDTIRVAQKTNKIQVFVVCENVSHWRRHMPEAPGQARGSSRNRTGACTGYRVLFVSTSSGRVTEAAALVKPGQPCFLVLTALVACPRERVLYGGRRRPSCNANFCV